MSENQTDPFDAVPARGTGADTPTFPELDDESPSLATDSTPTTPGAEDDRDPDGEDADS